MEQFCVETSHDRNKNIRMKATYKKCHQELNCFFLVLIFGKELPRKGNQTLKKECLFSALSCPARGSFTPKAAASKASDLLKWEQQLPAHSLHQNNFSFSTELGTYTLYNIQIMCIPILLLIYTYKNACHVCADTDTLQDMHLFLLLLQVWILAEKFEISGTFKA